MHPSLLFEAGEVAVLQARVGRAPYSSWWQTTLGRAQNVPEVFGDERDKVRYAKSLAFAYVLTDSAGFASQAAQILRDVRFPPRGGDMGEPHIEGVVVAHFAQAYDMLHGYLAAQDTAGLRLIRTLLAEEADRLYDGIPIKVGSGLFSFTFALHETPHIDNWHLRAYGGLGLAALALADHPGSGGSTPAQWAARALEVVRQTLVYQIDPVDGGYAEGPFYSRYAADVYLPYLLALRRLEGTDLLSEPLLTKMHDWSLALRLPDGRRPNIDDAHIDDFYGHYLAAIEADGGVHRWDWENNGAGLYVREYSEADAIAFYDDAVPAAEPDFGPTVFMPAAGEAVFRSDWSADATYLLLRGENGLTRERGLSHEHPDETSFVLYAGGEMLALDAGYINFDNHHKVNRGGNHNLVLVDGEGPPLNTLLGQVIGGGNDAFIENFYRSDAVEYAEVRAEYKGVKTTRRVMFVGGRYFVIADELRDDAEHTYEWRLHGNGGGTSGGTYTRQGNLARWSRQGAELLAYLPPVEGRSFAEVDTLHSFDFRQELTHTALRVTQTGSDVNFLSVLYPRVAGTEEPVFAPVEVEGGQAVEVQAADARDWLWAADQADRSSISIFFEDGFLRTDAAFGTARMDGIKAFAIHDGRTISVRFLVGASVHDRRNHLAVEADTLIDLSLTMTGDRVEGYVRGPATGYTLTARRDGQGPAENETIKSIFFRGTALDLDSSGGLLLADEGPLSFEFVAGVTIPGDLDGNAEVNFDDFFIFADNFGRSDFDPAADLDGDGDVDFDDFFIFADNFGKSAG